ncbi:MAG: DUF420 domain-containing protein [Gemmatimonadetes bacterium]|nr:DUF420 domain-containing protein [Gemmatimonadota bacterium]
MDSQTLGDGLAFLNALLNATSACALFVGYRSVRRRRLHAHRTAMVVAVGSSAIFLLSYVTRFLVTGTHEVDAEGAAKTVYLVILFSHMALATVVVPLVARLLFLVGRRRFRAHAALARWTLPVWAYVSVTGLVVYVLLYHVFGYR